MSVCRQGVEKLISFCRQVFARIQELLLSLCVNGQTAENSNNKDEQRWLNTNSAMMHM